MDLLHFDDIGTNTYQFMFVLITYYILYHTVIILEFMYIAFFGCMK